MIVAGCMERDKEKVFQAFASDPLVRLPLDQSRSLFEEMVENTKAFLPEYK